MNISHLILDNHVCAFEPRYENISGYPGFRISSNGAVESSLAPTPGKRSQWQPGSVWRPIAIMTARGNGVKMVSLRCEGKVRSLPLKRLIYEAFVETTVGPNESVKCSDNDENNVSLCNLEIVPGRFIRRTTLYSDRRK